MRTLSLLLCLSSIAALWPADDVSLTGPSCAWCQPYADHCTACKDCSACTWCSKKGGKCSVCLERR